MTKRTNKTHNPSQLVKAIVDGMNEVKAHQIVCLDLRQIPNTVTDFFVICHGTSTTQIEAIARSVEKETLEKLDEKPGHTEGLRNAHWVLMDYFNVVVHIFSEESRSHYGLEELWADAPSMSLKATA